MSGGGFRAAAFHAGVLKALEELELLPRLEVLSTVSGGAICGAYLAYCCRKDGDGTLGSISIAAFVDDLRAILTENLRRRALFGSLRRKLTTALSFGTHLSRMSLLASEMDRTFFSGMRLSEAPSWLLVNATNLKTGKSWKFFSDKAGDYLVGATTETERIQLSEAVAASAAYPVMSDPYLLKTRWDSLDRSTLDRRWGKLPKVHSLGRWRRKYGKSRGDVVFPLMDGGLYDNEGLLGLLSFGVTDAIVSSTAPPEDDFSGLWSYSGWNRLKRAVEVMHSRLGGLNRQWAWELTHGTHPSEARKDLLEIAEQLETGSEEQKEMANKLRRIALVGVPERNYQFRSTAMLLLKGSQKGNGFPTLTDSLAYKLSRVRTDLDALRPDVFDLLVSQGYGLAREIVPQVQGIEAKGPFWDFAARTITDANDHEEAMGNILDEAAVNHWILGKGEP